MKETIISFSKKLFEQNEYIDQLNSFVYFI